MLSCFCSILCTPAAFADRRNQLVAALADEIAFFHEAMGRFHGDFSVSELQAQCPNVGIDLIRRLLRQERKAGKLECLGRGPAARWRRK